MTPPLSGELVRDTLDDADAAAAVAEAFDDNMKREMLTRLWSQAFS